MDQKSDGKNLKFTDKEVCKPFLLGICINELFTNTRADLGECKQIHSLALRAEYERISTNQDYAFEEEVLEYLQAFIRDNEDKIEINRQRLGRLEGPESEAKIEAMQQLGDEIIEKMTKSEALAAEGKVDESQTVLAEVVTLKARKNEIEDDYYNNLVAQQQPEQLQLPRQELLQVCKVCGAFISLSDDDRRLMHNNGRLHMGYLTVRKKTKLLELRGNC